MSKKCCGFIYSDDDQICRICGNPLVDDDFISGGTGRMSDMDILLSSLASDEEEAIEEDYDDMLENEEAPKELETAEVVPEQYVVDLFASEDNKMDVLDEIEAEEQAAEEAKIKPGEEKAPTSMKVVGVVSIVLAVMALAMAGIFVYFMVIKPSYDKEGEALKQIIYPEIATGTDIDLEQPRPHISNEPLATSTDYMIYEPVESEIDNTESAETDATATDAGEIPEADVVE